MESKRKTVGLALGGASSRSIFYIGFLEVLKERQFLVDYIAATSSSAIVAAAYACGTLDKLKALALDLNKEFLFSLLEKNDSAGGFYSLEKVEQALKSFTRGLKFEEVRPLMGFVTTDVNSGEAVVLSIGDIAKAVCASCALPVLFRPVKWGNRFLVDGGLVSVVPGEVVKQAGIEVVIGIHLRTTAHIFGKWELRLKKIYNFAADTLNFNRTGRLLRQLGRKFSRNEYLEYLISAEDLTPREYNPGMFTLLGKAMDIAISAQQKHHPKTSNFACDFLIAPRMPQIPAIKRLFYLHFADFKNARQLYELGRKTALAHLPKMKQLASQPSASDLPLAAATFINV